MGAPLPGFENNSQPLEQNGDQSQDSSALSSSLWLELGSKLHSYLSSDTSASELANTTSLDFSVDDIYGQRSGDMAGPSSDLRRNDVAAKQFVPSDRADAHAHHIGEVIFRDVEPSEYTVKEGDSLKQIARDHLGPGATRSEIKLHAREIAQLNHIQQGAALEKDRYLDLPGHTVDGGLVSIDLNGDRRTSWRDGREHLERPDGTGYERKPTGGTGYSKIHWGPESTDNYEVVRTADGRYQLSDNPADSPVEPEGREELRVERERLSDLAESMSDSAEQFRMFQMDMNKFETRASQDGLPREEIARTYQQISRLLEEEGDKSVDLKHRKALAKQVIEQAADPTSIDQGFHNTCNVTTVETRMYTRNPSDAVKLVADMALQGEFATKDGSTIRLSKEDLKRHTESKLAISEDEERSYASQIFQVAAVNVYWQRQAKDLQGTAVPQGAIRYHQGETTDSNSTGETLENHSGTTPVVLLDAKGKEAHDPQLRISQYKDIYDQITHDDDSGFLLAHELAITSSAVSGFNSQDELRAALAQMKEDGTFPAIIRVDANNEPFSTDSGGGEAGGSGGWHVVTITDYDAAADRVLIDNQWGRDSDKLELEGGLSVQDLYLSTWESISKSHLEQLDKTLTEDSENGIDNPYGDIELLRLGHDAKINEINEGDKWIENTFGTGSVVTTTMSAVSETMRQETHDNFDKELAEKIVQIHERWQLEEAAGVLNEDQVTKVDEKLKYLVGRMPEARQAHVTELVRAGLSTPRPYSDSWQVTPPSADPLAEAAKRHEWWDQLQNRD